MLRSLDLSLLVRPDHAVARELEVGRVAARGRRGRSHRRRGVPSRRRSPRRSTPGAGSRALGVPPPGAARPTHGARGRRCESATGPDCSPPSAGAARALVALAIGVPAGRVHRPARETRLLNTIRSGAAGSNCVIALSIAKAGRARKAPPTSTAVAHSSYTDVQSGSGSRRMRGRTRAPGQLPTAWPKSAITRVCASSRPRRKSQVSSEWKRTVPRRGEPEPWCRTTIHDRPLRSSLTTKTLNPACGSSLLANAPIGPKAGMPVRRNILNACGFEPCSWPNAQWWRGSIGGCHVAQLRPPRRTV